MTPSRLKIHRTATAAGLLVVLSGCASLPPPTTEIAGADAAIKVASTPDSQHYAASELASAHNDLAAAQAAMAKQDYDRARMLVAAALADADLAHAKGRALAAQSAVVDKTEDNATLRRRLLEQEPLK
jgi:multidrug resistance efflux pump